MSEDWDLDFERNNQFQFQHSQRKFELKLFLVIHSDAKSTMIGKRQSHSGQSMK